VQQIKKAEAAQQAAEFLAKQKIIDADAEQKAAVQKAEAVKTLAEAEAARFASSGLAEAKVMEAKAEAREKQGEAEASVLEDQAIAEARGIEAKSLAQAEADLRIGNAAAEVDKAKGLAEAEVIRKKADAELEKGLAEAKVDYEKAQAEAEGIDKKAAAMKNYNDAGKDHEEFKLRLSKDKEIELAQINIQKAIADAQADVLGTALKSAKIDIVGGENVFFDKIVGAISNGKAFDRTVNNSEVFSQVRHQLLDDPNQSLVQQIRGFIKDADVDSEDIKNLSVTALIVKIMSQTNDPEKKGMLQQLLDLARGSGFGDRSAGDLGLIE